MRMSMAAWEASTPVTTAPMEAKWRESRPLPHPMSSRLSPALHPSSLLASVRKGERGRDLTYPLEVMSLAKEDGSRARLRLA